MNRIRDLRKDRDLRQTDVAAAAGGRRSARFLFKKKAAKKTVALNLEKNCGILSAASLYHSQSNSRTANSNLNRCRSKLWQPRINGNLIKR